MVYFVAVTHLRWASGVAACFTAYVDDPTAIVSGTVQHITGEVGRKQIPLLLKITQDPIYPMQLL